MKNRTLIGGLAVALLVAAAGCSSTGTANKTTNTSTTTTTTSTNTANRTTPPASNTSNTSGTSTSNTTAGNAPAEGGKQDFRLTNATGVEIDELHVSPHDVDDWQEDVLGRDTLPNGESVNITFSPKEKAAMWDIKVTDKEGTSIQWENLNLLEISEVTLHFDNGKPTATVK